MKYGVVPVFLLALCACGDDAQTGNAKTLWLALDGRETEVRLVEQEPDPF